MATKESEIISKWHSRTLNMKDDEPITLTASELRTLLWALHGALFNIGRNASNIDYNLDQIAKLKR